MADTLFIGQNAVVSNANIGFEEAGITPENCALIYEIRPGFAPRTYDPNRTFNLVNSFSTGTKFGYFIIMKQDADIPNVVPPFDVEVAAALDYIQLYVATDNGAGLISKAVDVDTSTYNAGGTVSGKLQKANGNYVEFTIPATKSQSNAVIFGLTEDNNGSYIFGTNPFIAGVYVYAPDSILKQTTGLGDTGTPGTDTTIATAIAGSEVVRLEVSGNNVLAKLNGVIKYTFTGVLSGKTSMYIKTFFAGSDYTAERKLLNVTGLGVS